jgi:alpha-glucoside transport system permease protein
MTIDTGSVKGQRTVAQRILGFFGHGVVHVVLIVVAVVWLLPTVGLFVSSFRTSTDSAASGWWTVFTTPAQLTFQNYANLVSDTAALGSLGNSVLIVVPTTILVVVIGSLAGYALSWMPFRGRDWVLVGIIVLLAVPLQVALIPVAGLFRALGLFGTIVGVVLFHTAFGLPFAIFLLRNFFGQVPAELLEASRLDGASEWRIFRQVVLPLGLPAIASLAIFQFLWTWNDMLVALIFSSTQSQPLTVYLQSQLRQFGANIDILSAGAFVSMIIPLIVFFAFQRYFENALLAGSMK